MFNNLESPTSGDVIIDGTILVNYLNQSYENDKSKYDFPTFQLIMVKNRFKNITFPLEIAGVPSGKAKQKHSN